MCSTKSNYVNIINSIVSEFCNGIEIEDGVFPRRFNVKESVRVRYMLEFGFSLKTLLDYKVIPYRNYNYMTRNFTNYKDNRRCYFGYINSFTNCYNRFKLDLDRLIDARCIIEIRCNN